MILLRGPSTREVLSQNQQQSHGSSHSRDAKSHVKDAMSMSGPFIMALTSTQEIQRSNGRSNTVDDMERRAIGRDGKKRAKECDAAGVKKEKGKPRGSYSKSAKDFRELKATQQQQHS